MSKEKLPEDRWITYIDKTYKFKTCTVTSSLAGSFLAAMMIRGMEPEEIEQSDYIEFETNGGYGSIIKGHPKMSFQIGDKTLVLMNSLVAETGKSLLTLKENILPTRQKYHVLYSRMSILVLTSEEVKLLIPQLSSKVVEARETSEAFMKQFRKSWNRELKSYKEKHGTDLPYEFVPVAKDIA